MSAPSLPARLLLSLSVSLSSAALLTLLSGVGHADSSPTAPPVEPQVQPPAQQVAPPLQGADVGAIAELQSPPSAGRCWRR